MSELKQFVVYRLSIDDEWYIGSTCNLRNRLYHHKSSCFNSNDESYHLSFYSYIRNHSINFQDIKVDTLEQVENKFLSDKENRSYSKQREQNHIDKQSEITGGSINNTNRAIRTDEDIKADNKANKKKYYEKNKAKIAEKRAKYRQKNKAKIAEQRAQKYKCDCGSNITISGKAQHEKTQKHIDFISQKQLEESDEESDEE